MNNIRRICGLIVALCPFVLSFAQTHWNCNINSYQYDMTVYLDLQLSSEQRSNYEVAAFCGNECRGVAELSQIEGKDSYFYLRVRSNKESGEKITFKLFNKTSQTEFVTPGILDFVSGSLTGYPSTPYMIRPIKPGDVNGDGKVTTFDATLIVQYILGNLVSNFIATAADINNDGKITTFDASQIVIIITTQQ